MRIELVREICYKLAADYGFTLNCPIEERHSDILALGKVGYKEELVRKKHRAGNWYDVEQKTVIAEITFSSHFLANADDEDILNVIRHELAHAFVFLETGKRQGHNEQFKAMCLRLGTKLIGTTDDNNILKYKVPLQIFMASLAMEDLI